MSVFYNIKVTLYILITRILQLRRIFIAMASFTGVFICQRKTVKPCEKAPNFEKFFPKKPILITQKKEKKFFKNIYHF